MSDFKAKMHQIRFRLGLCPRPRWGTYSTLQDPGQLDLRGHTSKGRKGRGWSGNGGEGKGGESGMRGDGKGRESKNVLPHLKQAVAAHAGIAVDNQKSAE